MPSTSEALALPAAQPMAGPEWSCPFDRTASHLRISPRTSHPGTRSSAAPLASAGGVAQLIFFCNE